MPCRKQGIDLLFEIHCNFMTCHDESDENNHFDLEMELLIAEEGGECQMPFHCL
jgi:hypothetical protein